jgi:hypothetical protein
MKIALDYDGTVTADPIMWRVFVSLAVGYGHDVRIVTSRFPSDEVPNLGVLVYYTSMKPKARYLNDSGWMPDIWIDDKPHRIFA